MRAIRVLMLRSGGWEQWVETVASHLGKNGFEVDGFVTHARAPEASPGPGVRIVGQGDGAERGWRGLSRWALRLRRWLSTHPYDVLYVVDSWSIPVLWLATVGTLRWRRMPLVYHTFEWIEPRVHGRVRCALERTVCRRADLVVNVDRVRGRVQRQIYELDRTPLWIRNGLSRSHPVPPRSEARRASLLGHGAPSDSVAVVSPSTAHPERLALELIRATALLPTRYRLAMIRGSGDYQEQCDRIARELGVSDRVTFLPRMEFGAAMECVASADVGAVLHSPASASLGNYLANPMRLSMFAACGVPVVASDLPTVAGDVYRHGLGVCCDPLDPPSIAKALQGLVEAGSAASGRHAIRKAFEDELCFERQAGALETALRELVSDAAGE